MESAQRSQSSFAEFRERVATYQRRYRHPDLEPLKVFGLYDLFPDIGTSHADFKWPDPWPHGGSAGVYLILDENLHLVYIGKASMNSSIAIRLSSYFVFDSDKKCKIKHPKSWEGQPRYVATVPLPDELRFEASALEEYLIATLSTTDNTAGVVK